MKDLTKSIVGIAAIGVIAIQCIQHNLNGKVATYSIAAIAGICLGAEILLEIWDKRTQNS